MGMKFGQQRRIQRQRQETQPKKRCRRIIKRDDHGRVKEERIEGCTANEMKMMKEGASSD